MPVLHFGGGTIGAGAFSTSEQVSNLLDKLQNGNVSHIDTAGVYPMSAPGESEKVLGAADAAGRGFVIDTKILVTGPGPGQGSLAKEAIAKSLAMSLDRLRVGKVREMLFENPPARLKKVKIEYRQPSVLTTPTKSTRSMLCTATSRTAQHPWKKQQQRYMATGKKGNSNRFALFCYPFEQWTITLLMICPIYDEQLGLSNYSPGQVEEFLAICDKHGWVKPSVYQGQYNAVCRRMEKDLLPLLRKHGIVYMAFSPLAGGFLSGNLSLDRDLTGTRFADGNAMGEHYRPMYDKDAMHSAIKELHAILQPRDMLSMAGASLRWLCYHSALGKEDGVILGATKIEQLESNIMEILKGPLDESVADAFENVWTAVSHVAP